MTTRKNFSDGIGHCRSWKCRRMEWDRQANQMIDQFQQSGHPTFRGTSALDRGVSKRTSGRKTFQFTADSGNIEWVLRTITSHWQKRRSHPERGDQAEDSELVFRRILMYARKKQGGIIFEICNSNVRVSSW